LHALPHFSICWRISSFLPNIEFNVLAANLSHFVMYTFLPRILLYFLYYFQSVMRSSHLLLRLSHGPKKINRNKTNKKRKVTGIN
jgi:hypothetical protein